MGSGVWGLGFGVWGEGCGVGSLGFGVWGWGLGVGGWGLGVGGWGLGVGGWGLGVGGWGSVQACPLAESFCCGSSWGGLTSAECLLQRIRVTTSTRDQIRAFEFRSRLSLIPKVNRGSTFAFFEKQREAAIRVASPEQASRLRCLRPNLSSSLRFDLVKVL